MSSATFSQVRSQVLKLEKQTEGLLAQYSGFQNLSNTTANDEEKELDSSISQVLDKREEVIQTLNRICDMESGISSSKLQQLQRHKEVLAEHRRSYSKIKSIISEERNRNNLLFLVRSDIDAHKQRSVNFSNGNAGINSNDYILDERVRADNANSFAERLLQQAYSTRDELYSQRAYLTGALQRISNTVQRIPGINVLLSKINTRRKRDTLILASLIATCILLLFLTF